MESMCPLDSEFATEIAALIETPCTQHAQEYFDDLIAKSECKGVKVKVDGEFGKGLYADDDFNEGELVLKDQMLVGSQHPMNKMDCFVCSFCFRFLGSVELQIGRKLFLQALSHSQGECSASDSDVKTILPEEVIASLTDGHLTLPYSEQFALPSPCPCPGGCGEEFYCSEMCARSDWETSHSLLCTATGDTQALSNFVQHANSTNDIFLLAAKAISMMLLKYKSLKKQKASRAIAIASEAALVDISLLQEAWRPLSMGYKKRWWDSLALPEDVDKSNEASFRSQIKEVAFESLELLKAAIFDQECAPFFSLEIYGHIIGMFDLNNLDLVVASPVEDYFLHLDDLPPSEEKNKAEAVTGPILDALGSDYSICCQGTAFFPLQSCMNHSCAPNAKAFKRDQDKDGQATIVALRHIPKGEELTISYIDEELPYEDRQASLADYGFTCKCSKCLEEQP